MSAWEGLVFHAGVAARPLSTCSFFNMNESASEQDEANPAFWLATRAGGRAGLTLPARDFPRWSCKEKVFFLGHITPLLTKREVKTARYCPRTYTLPMFSRLDRTSLVKVNNTYSWFATTRQGGHVGFDTIEFTWKYSLVPRGERCFCSWPPTWPPWRHVQTSDKYYHGLPHSLSHPEKKTSVPGELFLV